MDLEGNEFPFRFMMDVVGEYQSGCFLEWNRVRSLTPSQLDKSVIV